MSTPMPHREFPCDECPFRADNCDNPASQFPAERWKHMKDTAAPDTHPHPMLGEPVFGCHKGEPGTGRDLACAGYLATLGADHVGVRLAVTLRQLPTSALSPGPNWPPLHASWAEVVRHHTAPAAGTGRPAPDATPPRHDAPHQKRGAQTDSHRTRRTRT